MPALQQVSRFSTLIIALGTALVVGCSSSSDESVSGGEAGGSSVAGTGGQAGASSVAGNGGQAGNAAQGGSAGEGGQAGQSSAAGNSGQAGNGASGGSAGAGTSDGKIPIGGNCSINMGLNNCVDGAYCGNLTDPMGPSTCIEQGKEGDACDPGSRTACVMGFMCSHDTKTCVAAPAPGTTCHMFDECGPYGYCDFSAEACVAKRDVGGACVPDAQGCDNGTCYTFSDMCLPWLGCSPKPNQQGCFSTWDCNSGQSCCSDGNGKGVCVDGHSCPNGSEIEGVCSEVNVPF